MSCFSKDFSDANADFSIFKGEILKRIGGSSIIDVEKDQSDISKWLDTCSGIDAFQVVEGQLRGIAIRVQWGKAWDTFTIRYKRKSGSKTEYIKRSEAILNGKGFIYPYLTIQAYLDERGNSNNILSCGIIKTLDLYSHIFTNIGDTNIRTCNEGNDFIYVDFMELANTTKNIIIFGKNH